MPAKLNWIGLKSGRWTVLEYTPKDLRVLCVCECGTKRKVLKSSFSHQASKSCGCHKREVTIKRSYRHGHAYRGRRKEEYETWSGMMKRCYNHKCKKFKDYGGRGISVCARWHDAATFFKDCGPRPSKNHSWGRINNDGNYEPRNCRWETVDEQSNNKRSNVFLTLGPCSLTLTQWAKERPMVSAKLLSQRKLKGWSDIDCLLTPLKRKKAHS